MKAVLEVFQELIRHYMGEASMGRVCTERKKIAAAVLPQLAMISTKWLLTALGH